MDADKVVQIGEHMELDNMQGIQLVIVNWTKELTSNVVIKTPPHLLVDKKERCGVGVLLIQPGGHRTLHHVCIISTGSICPSLQL